MPSSSGNRTLAANTTVQHTNSSSTSAQQQPPAAGSAHGQLHPILLQELRSMSARIAKLQDSQTELTEKVDRLSKVLETRERNSFKIDKSNYQVNDNNDD